MLVLPVFLLMAVIVRTTRRMRAPYVPPSVSSVDTMLAVQPAGTAPARAVPAPVVFGTVLHKAPDGAQTPFGPLTGPAPILAERAGHDIVALIAQAETDADEEALPSLYLALAKLKAADGRTHEAADLLRKCIVVASRRALDQPLAAARLELGDLAHRAGDLSTACEHWQMARGLFRQLDQRIALSTVETRMRDNGCPTDWVLNDF